MNAPFLRPSGRPIGVGSAEWRQTLEAQLERLHDSMLSLIAALDTMDGDADLEPWLAGFDGVTVPADDREGGDVLDEGEPNDWDDEDGDADEGDEEPFSLDWSGSSESDDPSA